MVFSGQKSSYILPRFDVTRYIFQGVFTIDKDIHYQSQTFCILRLSDSDCVVIEKRHANSCVTDKLKVSRHAKLTPRNIYLSINHFEYPFTSFGKSQTSAPTAAQVEKWEK